MPTSLRPCPRSAAMAAILTLVSPFAAVAEPTVAEPSKTSASAPLSKGEIKAIKQFHMLDFNGDGKLSRKEVAIVPKLYSAFDDTDTNKDGFVTLEEVRAFAIKYRAARDKAKAEQAQAEATQLAKDADKPK
ncbi:EF-hand domain-containing protein [Diaphorobacter sp.]|uniref:EF-hand domain-containing protein n=1 Tax=Diaphorobacter sp. TaxID=1934310 RepID=UPI0028AC9C3A|nr:EF-hand domain-containing protein [Diaphorobacter sp.]